MSSPIKSAYEFDYGVFIGRFQPLHRGHEHIISVALLRCEHLIIAIGHPNSPRTPVNPFSFDERMAMIVQTFRHEVSTGRLIVIPAEEEPGRDEQWASNIEVQVEDIMLKRPGFQTMGVKDFKVALTGYGKDASSYYLNLFPNWANIQIEGQWGTINATEIRHDYLRRLPRISGYALNGPVVDFLESFALTGAFKELLAEEEYYEVYPKKYGSGPHLTADVVLTWQREVLLVTRGKTPGKGLLAFPGGFLNPGETFIQAAMRELQEETGLALAPGFVKDIKVIDTPNRSLRGRVVSVAHRIRLFGKERPIVKGMDDAQHAAFYRPETLKPEQFFEDHYQILRSMV